MVESGFFPGVILYLTFWYTSRHRARMVAVFMAAAPVSGVIAGPFSGWILDAMRGTAHLAGWQWMLLLEGLPAIGIGFFTLLFLTDNPAKAKWLERGGKSAAPEAPARGGGNQDSARAAATASATPSATARCGCWRWSISASAPANYGISFWLPQIIKDGIASDPLTIGWITAIPWTAAAIAMILWGRHSDATGERRWHFALSMLLVAVGFAGSTAPGLPGSLRLAALSLRLHRHHGRFRRLLGAAHRAAFRSGGGRGNRLDQLRGQPGRLCRPLSAGHRFATGATA